MRLLRWSRRGPDGTTDAELLRRAWRRSVVHVSIGMAVLLVVAGAAVFALLVRDQSYDFDRSLVRVLASAEDVDDPPPGMLLARLGHDGRVHVTGRTSPEQTRFLTKAVRGPARRFVAGLDDGHSYRVVVGAEHRGDRFAVAGDRQGLVDQRWRYLQALALAEGTALVGAVAAAALLSRRSVRPLAQALQLQREFIADASHELRAPLTVLHTRAQVLQANPITKSDPTLQHDVDELVDDTRALDDVIEDLLVSADLPHRRDRVSSIDTGDLARQAVRAMSPRADAQGKTITVTDGAGGCRVLGHPTALRRAMVAVLDNSIVHARSRVDVTVQRSDDQVVVDIADDGPGFDPERGDQLFDRHTQGSDDAPARFGIGLSLVKHIVESHGGAVTAITKPGAGATFTVRLPVGNAEPRVRGVLPKD